MNQEKKSYGQHGKLNELQKVMMIKMLGVFCEPQEIIKFFRSEYHISITPQAVSHYKLTHAEEIQKSREDYLKDLEILPVTDKVYRIKLRQDMINDIVKPGKNGKTNLWVTKYGGKQGQHLIVNRLLDSIQEELEPGKSSMNYEAKYNELLAKMELSKANATEFAERLHIAYGCKNDEKNINELENQNKNS